MNVSNARVCLYRAWLRVDSEYNNLKLSYFWEIISLLFVVSFLTIVWGRVLENSSAVDYFFYVLLGFSVWNLMSRCLDQCISFKNRCYVDMKRGGTTLQQQFTVDVGYCFIQFLLVFPFVVLACFLVYGVSFLHIVCLMLSLVCIFFTSYALFATLGMLAAFYEDISRLIRTVMRVAFLMTPILWFPEMLGENFMGFVYLNPFFSYLDVFRTSLLVQPIQYQSLFVMLLLTLTLHFLGKFTFRSMEKSMLRDIFLESNA